MGAKVSRVARMIRKPLETQRRVEKILENKPRPAPRHPSSQASVIEEGKRNEALFKERDRKDETYVDRLREFKIDSVDVQASEPITGGAETTRKLPQSREHSFPRELGKPPKGKITPVRLSELFARRVEDPDKWTAEKLAEYYQLDKEAVAAVVEHFSDYAVARKRDYPRPQDDVSFIN